MDTERLINKLDYLESKYKLVFHRCNDDRVDVRDRLMYNLCDILDDIDHQQLIDGGDAWLVMDYCDACGYAEDAPYCLKMLQFVTAVIKSDHDDDYERENRMATHLAEHYSYAIDSILRMTARAIYDPDDNGVNATRIFKATLRAIYSANSESMLTLLRDNTWVEGMPIQQALEMVACLCSHRNTLARAKELKLIRESVMLAVACNMNNALHGRPPQANELASCVTIAFANADRFSMKDASRCLINLVMTDNFYYVGDMTHALFPLGYKTIERAHMSDEELAMFCFRCHFYKMQQHSKKNMMIHRLMPPDYFGDFERDRFLIRGFIDAINGQRHLQRVLLRATHKPFASLVLIYLFSL